MKKLQSDKNLTKQIRIEAWWHKLLKLKATESGISVKTLLEGHLADIYKNETSKKPT